MNKAWGIFLITVSLLLFLAGTAAIVAAVHSLTVESTLTAVESAFGTGVLAILLMVLGRKTFHAGKARLRGPAGHGPGDRASRSH